MWLLDEPTVSLDRDAAALFEGVLDAHLARGGAAVLSTHLPIARGREIDLAAHRAPAPDGWL